MELPNGLDAALKPLLGPETLIIGMGNSLRGDDAVGPFICEKLKRTIPRQVIDVGTVVENYIQRIIKRNPKVLLIIDAIDFGAQPGEMRLLDRRQVRSAAISTHSLSPQLFLEVVCRSISPEVCFLAIQPARTRLGESLTPPVEQAGHALAEWIGNCLTCPRS
jgi:hydrogenase 3 maturation protease